MVVSSLVFTQLPLVAVAAAADAADKRLLASVDSNMGHITLATEESFGAGGAPSRDSR